jgi:hypothetical protein
MASHATSWRHRIAGIALAASVALHAAVIVGLPGSARAPAPDEPVYTAVLTPAALVEPEGPRVAPAAKPRPRAKPRKPKPPKPEEMIAQAPETTEPVAEAPPEVVAQAETQPEPAPEPEKVALAVPVPPPPAPEPVVEFPAGALPGNIKITYALVSSFADGRAVYEWERDGDRYVISGEAEAVGFFTLFLEGRIRQESRGKVTAGGLRPDRFTENRPNTAEEGLEFDWNERKVTFERSGEKSTTDLKDNTVDWLSMIFQLAHRPPKGESPFDMRVFTQRKMYQFRLTVVGEEEIELPIGKVRALHLRHEDPAKNESVDVWLGVNQHYVPVKLRYPVARNRVTVEQTAVGISIR